MINSFLQVGCQEPCELGEISNLAKVLQNVQVVWRWPQVHPGDHCQTQPQIHKINKIRLSLYKSRAPSRSPQPAWWTVGPQTLTPHSPWIQLEGRALLLLLLDGLHPDGPPWNAQPIPSCLLRTVEVATRSRGGHRGVPWDQFKFKNWNQLKLKAELNLSEMYDVTASFRLRPGAKPNNLYIHQAGKLKSWGRRRAVVASFVWQSSKPTWRKLAGNFYCLV